MANLTKEYFDKQLKASEQRVKAHVNKKFDDVNQRTARGFTGVQEQIHTMDAKLNDVQKKVTDADLQQIKKDNKLIKNAIGISA